MMETWGGPAGDRGPGGERPLVGKGVEGERSCSLGLVLGEEEEESEEGGAGCWPTGAELIMAGGGA